METSDEEFVSEEETDEGPAALKKLRERLKKAVEESREYLDGWQRSRADFANYKREEASMHNDKESRIKAEFLEALLPTLDTFELSLRHGAGQEIEMIYKQLLSSLKQAGVEQFGAPGEAFDPYLFEALQEVLTDDEQKDHTVERVQRAGYRIGDRVVRPAQVAVFSYKK